MSLRICCISDTHGRHRELEMPEADILVVAGDISSRGYEHELIDFNKWLGEIKDKYKHIILVAGNHDFLFQNKPNQARKIMRNATYLEDSGIEIDGFKIWGSPHQPWFGGWAFNQKRGADIDKYWQMIPDDINILITHGPPYGVLDEPSRVYINEDSSVGCLDLRRKIDKLADLKAHIFGHIHDSRGVRMMNNSFFVNASSTKHPSSPVWRPQVIVVH